MRRAPGQNHLETTFERNAGQLAADGPVPHLMSILAGLVQSTSNMPDGELETQMRPFFSETQLAHCPKPYMVHARIVDPFENPSRATTLIAALGRAGLQRTDGITVVAKPAELWGLGVIV